MKRVSRKKIPLHLDNFRKPIFINKDPFAVTLFLIRKLLKIHFPELRNCQKINSDSVGEIYYYFFIVFKIYTVRSQNLEGMIFDKIMVCFYVIG